MANTDNLNETEFWVGNEFKIKGKINNLKAFAVELRELAKEAGRDLSGSLGDVVFGIEIEYQAYHDLDEDNFEIVH